MKNLGFEADDLVKVSLDKLRKINMNFCIQIKTPQI